MKPVIRNIIIVLVLLSIPLIAMQFTEEVNWSLGDFLIGGLMLFGLVTLIGYLLDSIENKTYRMLLVFLVFVLFLLVWTELAVGIF